VSLKAELGSLKVIQGHSRSLTMAKFGGSYDFLSVCYLSIVLFCTIWRWRISWPWNQGWEGSLGMRIIPQCVHQVHRGQTQCGRHLSWVDTREKHCFDIVGWATATVQPTCNISPPTTTKQFPFGERSLICSSSATVDQLQETKISCIDYSTFTIQVSTFKTVIIKHSMVKAIKSYYQGFM